MGEGKHLGGCLKPKRNEVISTYCDDGNKIVSIAK